MPEAQQLVVRLNIFSGRQDPEWTLSEKQAAELAERQSGLRTVTMAKPPGVLRGLGYRGLEVLARGAAEMGPMHVHGGVLDAVDFGPNILDPSRELETWLLGTAPRAVEGRYLDLARRDLEMTPADFGVAAAEAINANVGGPCPPNGGAAAPPYDPARWNTPTVEPSNNCYNYANDQITNTFAQPGRGTGAAVPFPPTCDNVVPAAQRDGLVVVPTFSASIPNKWYVAVVIWPDEDYHWYRQDSNGCWSHKPGRTPARDYDNSGAKISDPRACDRGPYTQFCTYMTTDRTVTIR